MRTKALVFILGIYAGFVLISAWLVVRDGMRRNRDWTVATIRTAFDSHPATGMRGGASCLHLDN